MFDINGNGYLQDEISWNEDTPSAPDILFNNVVQEEELLTFEVTTNEDLFEGQNDIIF